MITITNGQNTLTVPNSAYEMMFKDSGYHPLADEERTTDEGDNFITEANETPSDASYDEENESLSETPDEEEEAEVDLSEIPLSEMDFYQLCAYADQLGVDRRGIRSKRELRALIKSVL